MRSLASILIAFGLAGCITPSIPIPPPDPTEMTFDIDVASPVNTATFSYPPDDRIKDAVVYVFNRDQGEGIILSANADGSVGPTKPFPAMPNNQVVVTFQDGQQSVSTCIRIRQGTQSATAYCD
jgi:hypothetical protein